ncbi:MAG: protein translocase subunit SecD, partial [Verrucomicrobia bacterium]|nr:protein translocase subunit SecD [Verrucomicrobiota bacterium]
ESGSELAQPAYLQFRMVHKDNDRLSRDLLERRLVPEGYRIEQIGAATYYALDEAYPKEKRTPAYRELVGRFRVPDAAHELLLEQMEVEGRKVYMPYFVNRYPELTGEYLEDASTDFGQMNEAMVLLRFDARGTRKFAQVTKDYAPGGLRNPNLQDYRQLAIVLDSTLYSAPRLNEPINGGRAQITGRFTFEEAQKLANILRAGALPAPVQIVEKRTVSPSLGQAAITSGVRGALYGSVLVVLFMGGYYLLAGLVANVALLLMVVLMPLGMIIAAGFLGIFASDASGGGPIALPVLTLPGIAGFALTIGMAVDANVLIFERIREEQAAGKRFWTAIEAGYNRAFSAIIDSNVTTLLTGVILFVFGSGPIRGYAVTLSAGIIMSMFTAIVVTRLIFGLLESTGKIKHLKMFQLIKTPSIDFLRWGKACGGVSVALIIITWGLMVSRGAKNPGEIFAVDFTGGASLTYSFQEHVPAEDLRQAIEKAGVRGPMIQYQKSIEGGGEELLVVQVSTGNVDGRPYAAVTRDVMANEFPTAGLVLGQDDEVGSQIGKELTGRSVKALIYALVGIILYLWIRFEIGFAMGAIAALIHDVLVTVGVFTLLGQQLSLPIVAALLTIVGFSVNDTIVIFDRIREGMRLEPNKPVRDVCNHSINLTLSRTLLTSFTVLITVVMLLIYGGGSMFDFALAMFIGLISGTYSTVYVATPVALLFHRKGRPDFTKN